MVKIEHAREFQDAEQKQQQEGCANNEFDHARAAFAVSHFGTARMVATRVTIHDLGKPKAV